MAHSPKSADQDVEQSYELLEAAPEHMICQASNLYVRWSFVAGILILVALGVLRCTTFVNDVNMSELKGKLSLEHLKMVPSLIEEVPLSIGRAFEYQRCVAENVAEGEAVSGGSEDVLKDGMSKLCGCAVVEAHSTIQVQQNLALEGLCLLTLADDQQALRACFKDICPEFVK